MRKYFEQWASIFPWFVNKPLDCEENGKYLSDLGYDDHDSQILYEGFKAGVDYSRKHTSPKGYVPKWDGKCSDCGKEGHIRCGDFGIISPGGGNPSQNRVGGGAGDTKGWPEVGGGSGNPIQNTEKK